MSRLFTSRISPGALSFPGRAALLCCSPKNYKTVMGTHAVGGNIFLALVLLFLVRVIPWLLAQVLFLVFQVVYGCCCCYCCWCVCGCLAPRSSWLGKKLLVSGYWLLSKGMWWTLWTCVFRFPFWEARYGQRWQQNGLSPEEHTHNAEMKLEGLSETRALCKGFGESKMFWKTFDAHKI